MTFNETLNFFDDRLLARHIKELEESADRRRYRDEQCALRIKIKQHLDMIIEDLDESKTFAVIIPEESDIRELIEGIRIRLNR